MVHIDWFYRILFAYFEMSECKLRRASMSKKDSSYDIYFYHFPRIQDWRYILTEIQNNQNKNENIYE